MDVLKWLIGLTILVPLSMYGELNQKQRRSLSCRKFPILDKRNSGIGKILWRLLYEKIGNDSRFVYYSKKYILFHSILSVLLLAPIYFFELYYSKIIVVSYIVFVFIESVPVFTLVALIIVDDFVLKEHRKNKEK